MAALTTPPDESCVRPHVVARVRAALAVGARPTALDVADAILRAHRIRPFLALPSQP